MRSIDVVRADYREQAHLRGLDPRHVDVLLCDATGKSLATLIAHGDEPFDAPDFDRQIERLFNGEPLQYVRGKAYFFGREFAVDHRVLIPRPETEILVETALDLAPRGGTVIDVGSGSGCIGISIERTRPDLRVFAVDISVGALAVTDFNRRTLQSRLRIAASDLLAAVRARFDLIVSNPPYIPEVDIAGLDSIVRDHEPQLALTPGPRGTEAIGRLLDDSMPRLARGGRVVFEMGFGQERDVRDIAAARGYRVVDVIPDLAGIPRVVVLSAA